MKRGVVEEKNTTFSSEEDRFTGIAPY